MTSAPITELFELQHVVKISEIGLTSDADNGCVSNAIMYRGYEFKLVVWKAAAAKTSKFGAQGYDFCFLSFSR